MRDFDQITRDVKMAKAYRTITEAMGPSEQLIAFVNFDGKLGEEIGLEGFDNFSLQTKHELLLSKLQTNLHDMIAIEGIGSFLKKISNTLSSPPKGGEFKKYGDAKLELRNDTRAVLSASFYRKHLDLGKEAMALLKEINSKNLDEDNNDYFEKYEAKCENIEDRFEKIALSVPMKSSGWDETKLKEAIAATVAFEKEFNTLSETMETKFKKYGKVPASEVPKGFTHSSYSYNLTASACNHLFAALNSIAACYKIVG